DAAFLRYVAGLAVVPSPETYVYENVWEVDESPYPSQGVWHVIVDNTVYGVARPAGYTSQVHFLVLGGGTSFGVFFGRPVVSASLVVLGGAPGPQPSTDPSALECPPTREVLARRSQLPDR